METLRNSKTPVVKGCHCLDYVGGTFADGYGAVWSKNSGKGKHREAGNLRGRVLKAHRIAYEEAHGPVPKGKLVCHHCDRKICVEPRHLYAGTMKQNMRDCIERGRFVPSNLRHDDKTIAAIRAAGGRQVDIARRFGVSQSYVSQIRRHKVR